jgi:hypothetical protein
VIAITRPADRDRRSRFREFVDSVFATGSAHDRHRLAKRSFRRGEKKRPPVDPFAITSVG